MDIVKIEERVIGGEKVQAVNARELHEKLEVGRDFSTWIKQRLDECMALEGSDYNTFTQKGETATGGFRTKEYALSLDIAKHIAMLERSEAGRKIRQYFIDVEKKSRVVIPEIPTTDTLAAKAFRAYKEIGEMVQMPPSSIVSEAAKIIDRKYGTNLVEFTKTSPMLDHVQESEEFLEPTELGQRLGMSAISVNKKLQSLGLQYKANGGWLPTEEGKKISFIHQWTTGEKSGYNLKWNCEKTIERIKDGNN